jgi:hypothetical protein
LPTIKVVEALRFFVREGMQWRELRATAGRASGSTLRRRLDGWSATAVLRRVRVALVRMVRAGPEAAPWDVVVDSCSVRAKRGGELTGPNPTDRGKAGTKYHVLASTDGGTDHLGQAQQMREEPCVVDVGSRGISAKRGVALRAGEQSEPSRPPRGGLSSLRSLSSRPKPFQQDRAAHRISLGCTPEGRLPILHDRASARIIHEAGTGWARDRLSGLDLDHHCRCSGHAKRSCIIRAGCRKGPVLNGFLGPNPVVGQGAD